MTAANAGSDEPIEVIVPLSIATDGFPAICAVTGGTADGAIPLRVGRSATRWRAPKIRVPMSEAVFTRWSRRKNIHIKARGIASVLTAVGLLVAFRNGMLGVAILAVAVAIHLVDLWAERSVRDIEPVLERVGADVRITGVHERFAQAVRETVG